MTNVDGCEQDRDQAIRLNDQMTQTVAKVCKSAGAFLIFFSTDYVFDGTKKGEYREDDPIHPLNVYGESKARGEQQVREHAGAYAIFRVSWLYGVHGKSFPRTILEKAKQQSVFEVVNDQIGRPTFTKDLAAAFRDLLVNGSDSLKKMKGQIFHLANAGACSWAEFAAAILSHAGYDKVEVKPITSEQLTRPAKRPKNSVLNLSKAERVLGLKLRPWQEAMVEFINEFAIIRR